MPKPRGQLLAAAALTVILGIAFGLYWFTPWKLFTHSHVDEALPGPVVSTAASAPTVTTVSAGPVGPSRSTVTSPSTPTPSPPTPTPTRLTLAVVLLGRAAFGSGEHATTGTAAVLGLPDGRLVVRLENFSTSDGPDVRVVLASTPAGSDGVGRYLQLGHLKATSGNQNYAVPADSSLSSYRSIVIWCKRFDAVFGSAPLALA